jgi:hypothetical protein
MDWTLTVFFMEAKSQSLTVTNCLETYHSLLRQFEAKDS